MFVKAVFMHFTCAFVPTAEVSAKVLFALTVIVPAAVLVPPVHPPVMVTV